MELSVIGPRRLYQAVADQIAQMILAKVYRPGERLPPERDLVRQLGVSRPVIREAMIALELAGLVEVRVGSGAYIRRRRDTAASSEVGAAITEIGPFDLFHARLALEGEIAAKAAENVSAGDMAEMAAAVEQMRSAERNRLSTKPANRRFHVAVAVASKSPILIKLFHVLWDEMNNRGPLWAKLNERRLLRPTRVAEHKLIMNAIGAADPDRARAATRAHVQAAMTDYLDGAAIDPIEAMPGTKRVTKKRAKRRG